MNLLLESVREAQQDVEAEIARVTDPLLGRRREALQLASYKLVKLSSHVESTHKLLNDLRMLRRVLIDKPKAKASAHRG
jgi:hypothetical protein